LAAKALFLLPHQLKLTRLNTALKVTVKQSVFQGTHHLISGDFEGTKVYFNYHKPMRIGRTCHLALLNNII
jgi:hypothetical protein